MRPKITIDGVDITEHVAAMFDMLSTSLEWGSGFLSIEEIESILIVGDLAGFPGTSQLQPSATSIPGADFKFDEPRPRHRYHGSNEETVAWQRRYESAHQHHEAVVAPAAIAAWRAQLAAKIRALKGDK